jgi:multidrug efflux system membrane fusion protein
MKKIIIIVIILALIVLAYFRLKSNYEKINTSKDVIVQEDVVSVNSYTVKKMDLQRTLNLVGTLAPDKEVNIAAETQGKITSLNCEQGDYKSKGSIIASIDDRLKKLAVKSAKIEADKLKKDLERYENLYSGGTSSEQELDNARISYDNAIIALEQAEKELSYTSVTSPINGIITKKLVEIGTYVNAGTPIASIIDISRLKVEINVSEANVYYLKVGSRVEITTDIYPGISFNGRISFISPQGDDAHNYPVEVEITNTSNHPLKSGTFVNVKIDLPGSNALYIPRDALLGSSKEAKVYVIQDGKAKSRSILLGTSSNEYLEVLSGLNEGEQVVQSGQVNLSDNKPVKIITNN